KKSRVPLVEQNVDGDERKLDCHHGGEQDAAGPAVFRLEVRDGQPPNGGERRNEAFHARSPCDRWRAKPPSRQRGHASSTPPGARYAQPLSVREKSTSERDAPPLTPGWRLWQRRTRRIDLAAKYLRAISHRLGAAIHLKRDRGATPPGVKCET